MALPSALPPTLESWALKRARGESPSARLWEGVPLPAAYYQPFLLSHVMANSFLVFILMKGQKRIDQSYTSMHGWK